MPRVAKYDRHTALNRAVALFWERGYFASSLKHIEQALDMRPGSLYATFGSKSGLFAEALDLYAGYMGEELQRLLDTHSSVLEALKAYFQSLACACTATNAPPARACMIVKTLLEVGDQEPQLQLKVNTLLDAVEHNLSAVLERAQQRGELSPDIDCPRLARLLQAQIIGLRAFAQRQTPARHVLELAEDMTALLDHYAQRSTAA
ncbi:TetR/AcrR family transcriptional regulator [Pseudomonas sp. sp1636]|uniref:TetR/AcrR family transcriptional regulator n=1 Tax=Pseudomonas sp. sp1636 TaxID=3036707 RepID=UPI0025A55AE7|nr:TetR/AcrR family transcriptional regulator [Pseudomonas sp. sp1636]MDM8349495.1 TetR/AcrR family transcriptional regulator [Pseudomonas sp. sp1636]